MQKQRYVVGVVMVYVYRARHKDVLTNFLPGEKRWQGIRLDST